MHRRAPRRAHAHTRLRTTTISRPASSQVWVEVINLAQQPHFGGIDTHLANHADEWRRLYDSATPETEPMPAPWERNLSQFEKLLVLRCLRPDKCVTAIQNFVEAHLGRRFIEPPPFDLNGTTAEIAPRSRRDRRRR